MSESDFMLDREHRYKCGTGRSPTLSGESARYTQLNGISSMNGDGSTDTKDWA